MMMMVMMMMMMVMVIKEKWHENFSDDINMEFGLEKCAKITFKRGKLTNS